MANLNCFASVWNKNKHWGPINILNGTNFKDTSIHTWNMPWGTVHTLMYSTYMYYIHTQFFDPVLAFVSVCVYPVLAPHPPLVDPESKARPVVPCGWRSRFHKIVLLWNPEPMLGQTLLSDTAIVCVCWVPKQLSLTAAVSNIDRVKWLQIACAFFSQVRECAALILFFFPALWTVPTKNMSKKTRSSNRQSAFIGKKTKTCLGLTPFPHCESSNGKCLFWAFSFLLFLSVFEQMSSLLEFKVFSCQSLLASSSCRIIEYPSLLP